MKKLTNEEFTELICKTIREMKNEEVSAVEKGLYLLYNKINSTTEALQFSITKPSKASRFFKDITCMSVTELVSRVKGIKKDEVPY